MDSVINILLVDDEQRNLDALEVILEDPAYRLLRADDADKALRLLLENNVAAIVLDIKMPGVSGFELAQLIKGTKKFREIPIVFLTAYMVDDHDILAGYGAGAVDYLTKPVKPQVLRCKIAVFAELFRKTRALAELNEILRATATLYEATRSIIDANEPRLLPQIIVEVTSTVMSADDASLMLLGAGGDLYVASSLGLSSGISSEARVAIGSRIARRVAFSGEPVVLPGDLSNDPELSDVSSHGRVRSSIVYPLMAGERVVGVLTMNRITNEIPYRDRDLKLASVLASQVLLALENARLLRELVRSERMASLGQLAASVAHEINNPVSYVLSSQGYLEEQLSVLSEHLGPLDSSSAAAVALAEIKQAGAEVREGALRVREIVREISSLARVDDASTVVFDLNESVRSAVRVAGSQLKHVRLVEQLGDDVITRGNPGRLSQVFVNLLVNAVQAFDGSHASMEGTIVVTSARVGSQVTVTVSDNGPGILRENLPRVFESFFTTKARTAGTGLGLAISREIARSYGGDVDVVSGPGLGAAFTLRLPSAEASAPRPERDLPPLTTGDIERPMRLLLVDDEPIIRRGYERTFGKTSEAILAADGEQAWQILQARQDFDVIVCDLLMPNVSGIELHQRVLEHYPPLAKLFIFVTGGAVEASGQAFLSMCANRILAKPFEMRELVELVEEHRPRHRRRSS